MSSSPPSQALPLSPSAAIPYHLLLHVEFTAPVLGRPVFAVDAAWLRRLGPALARARLEPGPVLVQITLVTPQAGDRLPALAEEPHESFVAALVDVLAESGLTTTANGVSIGESAQPRDEPCLGVAIYGRPP